MRRIKTRVVAVLFLCCVSMVSMLFYFILEFDDKKQVEVSTKTVTSKSALILGFDEIQPRNKTYIDSIRKRLNDKVASLDIDKLTTIRNTEENDKYFESLKSDLVVKAELEANKAWNIAKKWVRARQTIPFKAPELGSILHALQTSKIIKSDVIKKGTQLKLLLTLEGGQQVFFKPQRYPRDYVTDDIYSGADRHNGEIIAFHLSRILNLRFAPIISSRILNVDNEIKSIASTALLKTFVTDSEKFNQTRECFYGECYYCNEFDLVCADQQGLLEGAIILLLPLQYQLQKLRHPWQRTYKKNTKAQWENDSNFCFSVQKNNQNPQRILDFVDVSIFDYLIGNADRHHFEVFKDVSNSAILLIDNGKSFGDPSHDEITILFPLLQCCIVRNSTYQQLKIVAKQKLSKLITDLLSRDILWPLLTSSHLQVLDRRIKSVIAAIELCIDSFNRNYVLRNS